MGHVQLGLLKTGENRCNDSWTLLVHYKAIRQERCTCKGSCNLTAECEDKMSTTTMDHQLVNKNYTEYDEPSDVWTDLLFVGGFVLMRQLPTLLRQISDTISQIMDKGYAVHVKKGDFEVRFGTDQNMWSPADKSDSRVASV